MAGPEPVVQIEGLRELRLDLIRLDREYFVKAMTEAGFSVADPASRSIAAAIPKGRQRRVGNRRDRHAPGQLAATTRAGRVRTGAIVRVGYARVPYVGPVEFGNWPRGRPFIRSGRYIFPTAEGLGSRALAAYNDEIEKSIRRYPWSKPA